MWAELGAFICRVQGFWVGAARRRWEGSCFERPLTSLWEDTCLHLSGAAGRLPGRAPRHAEFVAPRPRRRWHPKSF